MLLGSLLHQVFEQVSRADVVVHDTAEFPHDQGVDEFQW